MTNVRYWKKFWVFWKIKIKLKGLPNGFNDKCDGVIFSYIKTCHGQHCGSITPRSIAGLRMHIPSRSLFPFYFEPFTWPTGSPSY